MVLQLQILGASKEFKIILQGSSTVLLRSAHIIQSLIRLHWLLIKQSINFKVVVISAQFKTTNELAKLLTWHIAIHIHSLCNND